tara:strand:+ start:485 stop:1270 length:786 start_codon:yes stop_codon:yes gene_type:complete
MAKYFIHPNANLYSADPVGGDQTGGTNNFAADSTSATDETRLTDISIGTAAGMPAQYDTVQFDLTASGNTIDSIAVHSTAEDADNIDWYANDSATTNAFATGITGSSMTTINAGWTVKTGVTVSSASPATRYYYMRQSAGANNTLTEVILGTQLSLTNVALSGSEGKINGNKITASQGGKTYSKKRHDGKKFWNFSLKFVSSSYKTSLETMRTATAGSHYKFLYYDGSAYYYVRMSDDSLQFKEVAFGVYDTNIKLIEQLS